LIKLLILYIGTYICIYPGANAGGGFFWEFKPTPKHQEQKINYLTYK